MHRNVEIWEARQARVEKIAAKAAEDLRQATIGAADTATHIAIIHRRMAWSLRLRAVTDRVWHGLCVAKGWRKA